MKSTFKTLLFVIGALLGTSAMAQSQNEVSLYIYKEVYIVDTAAMDSIVAVRNAERRADMERYRAELEAQENNDLPAIELLMEHEVSGKKVKDARARELLEKYANLGYYGLGDLVDKRKDMLAGYVPKGLTKKVLLKEKEKIEQQIERKQSELSNLENYYKPLSWNEVFPIGAEPKKYVMMPIPNPECRDNYFNGNFKREAVNNWGMAIDYTPFTEYKHWAKQDEAQQSQGWEWLNEKGVWNEMKREEIYFPEELSYSVHPLHPEYRFKYSDEFNGHIAYDHSGTLVRVHNMTDFIYYYSNSQKAFMENIFMQLCKRDFLANKYDINSAKPETLTALRITFGMQDFVDARYKKYTKMAQEARDEIVAATTVAQYTAAKKKQAEALNVLLEYVAKEREPQALNYIKQLKADHAAELSYLYKIERVSNTEFKVYFLNDKMECGCVALMKWRNKAPYEAEYEVELLPCETITIRR